MWHGGCELQLQLQKCNSVTSNWKDAMLHDVIAIQEATHRNQSTAMMRVMSSVGSPTEVRTITMVTRPAWGMPAAPILAAVAVILVYRKKDIHNSNKCHLLIFSFLVFNNFFFHCLPDGDDLTKVHFHIVDLSNKDGCQRLIQSSSIHVNGSTNR